MFVDLQRHRDNNVAYHAEEIIATIATTTTEN